jgi:hypothetical protein
VTCRACYWGWNLWNADLLKSSEALLSRTEKKSISVSPLKVTPNVEFELTIHVIQSSKCLLSCCRLSKWSTDSRSATEREKGQTHWTTLSSSARLFRNFR